jgi:uridylate kinase
VQQISGTANCQNGRTVERLISGEPMRVVICGGGGFTTATIAVIAALQLSQTTVSA